jgi:branched-chain amino acid transport system permease protein
MATLRRQDPAAVGGVPVLVAVVAVVGLIASVPAAIEQPASGLILTALVVAMVVAAANGHGGSGLRTLGPCTGIIWLQLVAYPMPGSVLFLGVVLGLLNASLALGMALIYRANRILNFAQADLGAAPTVLAVGLIAFSSLSWIVSAFLGLASALLLGAIVEFFIIRRFAKAPRLILTVATIGLSQLFTAAAALLPRLWGETALLSPQIDGPLDVRLNIGTQRYSGDHLLVLLVVPALLLGLTAFLRYTHVGVAVRAAAERADRASTLGVPVKRLGTLVWAVAAMLSFTGLFLRAGVVGLPAVSMLSFGALLGALTALVLGRLEDLPAITAAALALGILEQGVQWETSNDVLVFPVFGVIILVALVLRRSGTARSELDPTSSWQAFAEIRPIPAELRHLPEVRAARWGGLALGLVAIAVLPAILGPGDELKASTVAVFVLITASVVVLTGWAGQVSLGQMSFVAIGAAIGGIALGDWGFDLSLALLVSGGAGALAAIVVGLPALRLRGLFLAVTTLAFAVASSSYLLNRRHFSWLPREAIPRGRLFNTIDLTSQRSLFYVCAAMAVLGLVAVQGLRTGRTGRVLRAVRDNERGAQSYGVDVTRAKLLAFATSGFLAAAAGCLHVQIVGVYAETAYAPTESITVFTAAVVGGLGTLLGAVAGALFLNGGEWILRGNWRLLPSAIGVLVVLLALPGGLGDAFYQLRDAALRRIATRRGIAVPSMLADRRIEPEAQHDPPIVATPVPEPPPVVVSSAPGEGTLP